MKKILLLSIAMLSITGMQAMNQFSYNEMEQKKLPDTNISLTQKVKNILKKTEIEILKLIDDHAQISIKQGVSTIKQGGTVTLASGPMAEIEKYTTTSKYAKIEGKTKEVEYDSNPGGYDGGMDRVEQEHITVLKINTDAPIGTIIKVYKINMLYEKTGRSFHGSKVLYKTYKVVK